MRRCHIHTVLEDRCDVRNTLWPVSRQFFSHCFPSCLINPAQCHGPRQERTCVGGIKYTSLDPITVVMVALGTWGRALTALKEEGLGKQEAQPLAHGRGHGSHWSLLDLLSLSFIHCGYFLVGKKLQTRDRAPTRARVTQDRNRRSLISNLHWNF